MSEKLDRHISQKIRETFENHHEPYREADWQAMKAKLDQSDNTRKLVPWTFYGKAAAVGVLLLLGGLLIWGIGGNDYEQRPAISTIESINVDSLEERNQTNGAAIDKFNTAGIISTPAKVNNSTPGIKESSSKLLSQNADNSSSTGISESNKTVKNKTGKKASNLRTSGKDANNNKIASDNKNSNKKEGTAQNLETIAKASMTSGNNIKTPELVWKRSESLPSEEEPLYLTETEQPVIPAEEDKDKEKNIDLSVALMPAMNYSSSAEASEMSYGGGVLTEVPLSRHFSINTGLMVSKQQMNLNKNSFGQEASFSNPTTFNGREVAEVRRNLNNSTLFLTGVDLPLNVTYNFSGKAKGFLISMGVSSLTYLQEETQSSYTEIIAYKHDSEIKNIANGETSKTSRILTSSSQKEQNNSRGALSTFDWAGFFNFSVGLKQPLGGSALTLEPFVKYPLQTLTHERFKFGMGGVNLKFHFQ